MTRAIVTDLADEWVEITGIGPGGFTVLLDGREELLGRIEGCGLFQPKGVRVALGDRTWEIFEPGLLEAIREGALEGLRIECPSLRVAERLALAQDLWARDGTGFTLCGTLCGSVDAENFGGLTWNVPEEAGIEPPRVDAQAHARRTWLEGLVTRLSGPDALIRLHAQWDNASPLGYPEDAARELVWLRPHVQFARSG